MSRKLVDRINEAHHSCMDPFECKICLRKMLREARETRLPDVKGATIASLREEVERLDTELAQWKAFNNPCGHTGFESFVCEECGYPNPIKAIAALRARVTELEALANKAADSALDKAGKYDLAATVAIEKTQEIGGLVARNAKLERELAEAREFINKTVGKGWSE